ncbi:HEPN domain-containing protein [Vibrio rhizosphaerae]|uniref:ApeA N-terminal domain 1-containing protein n=1 Tax=Vibrio rhizosphaerae TaxID=398736 RepID=UPI000B31CCAF|nr:HEPN domain-containing protein [Vibrio rhizosphaerae]
MSRMALNFFESYKFTVKFNFDNQDLTGVLSFNQSGIPHLKIHTDNHILLFEECRVIEDPITCYEIGSNKTFTLHQSELQRGAIIICRFVTTGSLIPNGIDLIEVHLTGISTWFERLRSSEITETEFKRDTSVEKFSVNFNYNKNNYTIENHRYVSSTAMASTEHHIKIQDCFIVKKINGTFTLNEAESIALEIRSLFSLLLGYSLSIKELYLIPSEKRHDYQSLIFPSVTYEDKPLDEFHQALCNVDNLFMWNLWKTIIQNYFKIKSFRTIWNRLVVSLSRSKPGIWEYEILSVVVTLEMYCEQESKGKGHKLDKVKFNELKSQLSQTLEEFIVDNDLSSKDLLVLKGFESVLADLRNTSHPTLQQKYDFLMSRTSNDIKEAISFSEDDFKILKKIRNSVAHGKNYNTVINGEITKEVQLKDRLLTLLMYFVFHELGFSDTQIAKSLSYTHNSFIINAGGNERARDKLAGTARFITLQEDIDLKNFGSFDYIVVDYEFNNNQFTLNKPLSYETKYHWHGSGISDVRNFVKDKLPKDSNAELEYVNKLYISSGRNEKCYYGVILLTHR